MKTSRLGGKGSGTRAFNIRYSFSAYQSTRGLVLHAVRPARDVGPNASANTERDRPRVRHVILKGVRHVILKSWLTSPRSSGVRLQAQGHLRLGLDTSQARGRDALPLTSNLHCLYLMTSEQGKGAISGGSWRSLGLERKLVTR